MFKMINLKKEQIKKALPKIQKGIEQYLWLQKEVVKRNTSKDREFQRKFNDFYKVIKRPVEWYVFFYELLETNKNKKVTFGSMFKKLYKKTGKAEASFASKLVATIDPNMPIIDKVVFGHLGLRLPPAGTENRGLEIEKQYQTQHKEFVRFLATENGKYLVKQFTKRYPKAKITKIKMLDFVLWQTRDKYKKKAQKILFMTTDQKLSKIEGELDWIEREIKIKNAEWGRFCNDYRKRMEKTRSLMRSFAKPLSPKDALALERDFKELSVFEKKCDVAWAKNRRRAKEIQRRRTSVKLMFEDVKHDKEQKNNKKHK